MLKKILFLLIVLIVATIVFTINKSKIVTTKVSIFKPTVIPREIRPGFCLVNSVAISRPDAWRCMVGNEIYDPCFALASQDNIICGADPSNGEQGFLLKITQPLPEKFRKNNLKVNVWMIKLEDDDTCSPYTGTLPIIESDTGITAVQYGCQDAANGEVVGLVADSVVPGKIWHAKKISYSPTGPKKKNITIQDVVIKEVWQ